MEKLIFVVFTQNETHLYVVFWNLSAIIKNSKVSIEAPGGKQLINGSDKALGFISIC